MPEKRRERRATTIGMAGKYQLSEITQIAVTRTQAGFGPLLPRRLPGLMGQHTRDGDSGDAAGVRGSEAVEEGIVAGCVLCGIPATLRTTTRPISCYPLAMEGQQRESIRTGQRVSVVQKQDQRTGDLTEGVVERILTKSAFHPHGIKVKLTSGEVGRVKEIHD